MRQADFTILASLKLSGEATPEELEQLEQLLQQQPELGLQLELLGKIWAEKEKTAVDEKAAFNKHLQRLSIHLAQPVLQYDNEPAANNADEPAASIVRPINYKRIWLSVAAVACIISFFLLFYRPWVTKKTENLGENIVSAKPGTKSKIKLPDGTQVWLNADSKLIYGDNFSGENREVSLIGEAFFDVVKDKEHPFVIHTKTFDIRVLGTAFNVRSYPNDAITETALIRGIVEVTPHNNPDKKIILNPYEKLILQNSDSLATTARSSSKTNGNNETLMVLEKLHMDTKDSSTTETSWVKNTLAFDGEPLEDVALKLERWYDVKIIIADKKLSRAKYTGAYTNESLEEVLGSLKFTGKFNFNIKGKEVVIRP
jgi:transmembrane sensor